MAKKKKSLKVKTDNASNERKQMNQEDEGSAFQTPPAEAGRSDYGGLPNRDLKKNLGCG